MNLQKCKLALVIAWTLCMNPFFETTWTITDYDEGRSFKELHWHHGDHPEVLLLLTILQLI